MIVQDGEKSGIWGAKRLSVIIITWNQRETVRSCLRTVVPSVNRELDEVVVIDNGSRDGTDKMIAADFPSVLYHRVPKNLGVGPARNRGIALSSGRYLMTLDNDTLVAAGTSLGSEVEAVFMKYPKLGLFGFELLNYDGTRQRSARRFPAFLNPIAARVPGASSMRFFRRMQADHLMEDVDFDAVRDLMEVDYVLGANQVFRRAVLGDTYSYDPGIFYGPEDYEFCLRVWRSGWTVGWTPAVKISHEYRRVTKRFSLLTLRFIAAHIYVFLKYRGVVSRPSLAAAPAHD